MLTPDNGVSLGNFFGTACIAGLNVNHTKQSHLCGQFDLQCKHPKYDTGDYDVSFSSTDICVGDKIINYNKVRYLGNKLVLIALLNHKKM